MYKSLGIVNEETKKILWATTFSGSQISDLILNPMKVYKEKTEFESFVTNYFINNEVSKEKMLMGKILEPVVRQRAREEYEFNIKEMPETLICAENTYLTANLDGFIEEENMIVEIKCSEEDNIDKLYERYKYQIQYYIMFMEAKGAYLISLSNGWRLQKKLIEPDYDLIEQIKTAINNMIKCIEEKDPSAFESQNNNKKEVKEIEFKTLEPELKLKFLELRTINSNMEKLKESQDILSKEIKDLLPGSGSVKVIAEDFEYTQTKYTRSGNVDYKKLLADLDINVDTENYRGKDSEVVTTKFKNK